MHNNSIHPTTRSFSPRFSMLPKRAAIAGLAGRLLDLRGTDESALAALDAELNRRVYGLFGLSPDEVGIIEGEKG